MSFRRLTTGKRNKALKRKKIKKGEKSREEKKYRERSELFLQSSGGPEEEKRDNMSFRRLTTGQKRKYKGTNKELKGEEKKKKRKR